MSKCIIINDNTLSLSVLYIIILLLPIFLGLPSSFLFLSFLSLSLSWALDPCIKYLLDISLWISDRYFKQIIHQNLEVFIHWMFLHKFVIPRPSNINSFPVTQARELGVSLCFLLLLLPNQSIINSYLFYNLNNHRLYSFSPSLLPLLCFIISSLLACIARLTRLPASIIDPLKSFILQLD